MFTCNITGKKFSLSKEDIGREKGCTFGYNSRFRAIRFVLTKVLFNESKIVSLCQENKNIKGVGMNDGPWASILEQKFNYINTFYGEFPPYLDIYNDEHVNSYQDLDFIISSEVFNHINPYPGLQTAFNNLARMLKSGGFLIFSVPFIYEDHKEYYPSLYNYQIVNKNGNYIIENTTIEGRKETFGNLVFHGGPGNGLEMRLFSKNSIVAFLKEAGFENIIFHNPNEEMHKCGIFWENKCSLVLSAKKT